MAFRSTWVQRIRPKCTRACILCLDQYDTIEFCVWRETSVELDSVALSRADAVE